MYMKNLFSNGLYFNARCIIEGFALLSMYESGDVKPENIELFKNQFKILEYKVYRNYSYLDNIIFDFGLVKKSYDEAVEFYTSKLNHKSGSKIKKVLTSKLPFL